MCINMYIYVYVYTYKYPYMCVYMYKNLRSMPRFAAAAAEAGSRSTAHLVQGPGIRIEG